MSIHQHARNGTLVDDKLLFYIRSNPNIINELDQQGHTPLAIAAVAGKTDVVEQLLKRNADPNKLSRDQESALLLAACRTTSDRPRIVQLLLSTRLESELIDATTDAHNQNTPLMYAIINRDVESSRLLFAEGAEAETRTNSNGKSAKDLAEESGNASLQLAITATEETIRTGIARAIVDFLLYIVAFVNDTVSHVMREEFGLDPELDYSDGGLNDEVNDNEKPNTTEFLENVDRFVKEKTQGKLMEEFFKDKPNFVQEFAKNVTDLKDDTSTPLGQPDLLQNTVLVNLRKQVIYCDDSSSMKRKEPSTNANSRWDYQVKLVEKIAQISTRLIPKDQGVALRFINQDLPPSPDPDNLTFEDVKDTLSRMRYKDWGNTAIGTYLKSRILQPMVYDPLASGTFTRPLLITVITDGMPSMEPEGTFVEAIKECRNKLVQANKSVENVKFLIGQIGMAKSAAKFLEGVGENPEIKASGMVFVTTDQLDEKFSKFREQYHALDRWLIQLLFKPIGQLAAQQRQ